MSPQPTAIVEPPTDQSQSTVASSLASSRAVRDAIESLQRELKQAQSKITGVRPPIGALKATYQDALNRQTEAKGRPPLYPYVGSGLGNGALVELADGSVKFDMINGIGVHMFGHGDPDIVSAAVRAAMSDMIMQGHLQFNTDAIELAELLIAEAAKSSQIKRCFITNSGAMANENALKIAFHKNAPASRIIAFNDCFMGRSTTMAQIGDSAAGRVGVPLNVLVDYMPFYNPDEGQRSIDDAVRRLQQYIHRYPKQHAAFVFELIQGEGGFNMAPPEFFAALMKLSKDNGIAVWIDEVQTFGRTTRMYHFEQLGLGEYVDIVTIGKMSQACACLFTEDYNPKPGLLSATFVASSVALQTGRRILERLRDGGYYGDSGRIAKLQDAFREHAAKLVKDHPQWFPIPLDQYGGEHRAAGHFSGVGGMMRFTPFAGDRAAVQKALLTMFNEGVIAFYCGHGPYHVRFLPPIGVMQPAQFADVFEIVESSLERTARTLK